MQCTVINSNCLLHTQILHTFFPESFVCLLYIRLSRWLRSFLPSRTINPPASSHSPPLPIAFNCDFFSPNHVHISRHVFPFPTLSPPLTPPPLEKPLYHHHHYHPQHHPHHHRHHHQERQQVMFRQNASSSRNHHRDNHHCTTTTTNHYLELNHHHQEDLSRQPPWHV